MGTPGRTGAWRPGAGNAESFVGPSSFDINMDEEVRLDYVLRCPWKVGP